MTKYTPQQIAEMKRQGLTDEEIQSGNISIFEHLKEPTDRASVISCLRVLDMLPVMEQEVMDILISKLEMQNLFKQNLKFKLNKVAKLLESVNKDVYKECDKSAKKTDISQEQWYMGMYDFCNKFSNAIVNYIRDVELITNVSEAFEEKDRNFEIINKATMLSKLKEGDIFFFLDSELFCEYTYKGLQWNEEKNEYLMFFCKVENNQVAYKKEIMIHDNRLWRPVMVTNLLSEQELLNIKKSLNSKSCKH